MGVAENLEDVRRRIREAAERVGRDPEEIELVAVTKNVSVSFIEEAVQSGVENIGENRAQEAVKKFQQLGTEINGKKFSWHFVGHLQTNKVRQIIDFIDLIHSLSSLSLASEIDKRAGRIGKIQRVLVQVNVAKEKGKFGLDPDSVFEFLHEIRKLDNLQVEGLMTVPPLFDNPQEARPIFAQFKRLFDQARNELRDMSLKYLSMGMTNDFEIAIEEGSNMVRIGRAIFQERDEPVRRRSELP